MRLYKRGQYWWCSFPWQGETVRRSTRCTTRTAALLTAQRWERERADPDHAAAASATFGGAVTAFLADLERSDKPQATRQFYRRKAGTLTRILGADRLLSEVNAQLVDKYISTREQEPVAFSDAGLPKRYVSPNTIHKELVTLRQVLKRAKRRGEFRRDVSEVLPVGFSPRYVPRNVSLTFAEAERLLATLKPARAAAVAFALATTARRAEVFRALQEDIGILSVFLRGSKTEGSERNVSVAPFARPLLDFALANCGTKHPFGSARPMFRPWPNAIRGLRAACKRAKCPRVTWNDLRRTLSTWLVEGGVSDTVIAKMLGHVDTTMLHRVYGKPRQDAMGALLTEQSKAIPALTIGGKDGSVVRGGSGPGGMEGAGLGDDRAVSGDGSSDSVPVPSTQGAPEPNPGRSGASGPTHGREGKGPAESHVAAVPIAVRPAYACAAEQEPPQPIATSEQDENLRENSGNAVGPVGIEPTTKGLKVPKQWPACGCIAPLYNNGCWMCRQYLVRAVDVRRPWLDDPYAVDVQQTSEAGQRAPLSAEAPATSGAAASAVGGSAESAASPVRKTPAEGAGSPEEPPFSSVSRPGPQPRLADQQFDRERWDAQLLGACREALRALEAMRCI